MTQSGGGGSRTVTAILIVLIGQMGCLTLVVISLSVAAGLWLDNIFHSKPVLTLVLLLGGVPVSVLSMLFVARKGLERLSVRNPTPETSGKESA